MHRSTALCKVRHDALRQRALGAGLTLHSAARNREAGNGLKGALVGILHQRIHLLLIRVAGDRHPSNHAPRRNGDVALDNKFWPNTNKQRSISATRGNRNTELGLHTGLQRGNLLWSEVRHTTSHHEDQRLLVSLHRLCKPDYAPPKQHCCESPIMHQQKKRRDKRCADLYHPQGEVRRPRRSHYPRRRFRCPLQRWLQHQRSWLHQLQQRSWLHQLRLCLHRPQRRRCS